MLEHVGLADLVQAAEGIDQASVDADRKLAVPGAFADRVDDERSSRIDELTQCGRARCQIAWLLASECVLDEFT